MTTDWLEVAGRRLECMKLDGDPALPTLVLLHEGLGCVALWRDFPERLAAATGHPVFLYSRFGYGGSDPEPLPWRLDYMQHEGTHVLPQVLAAAGIDDYVLIGHSDGASIALVHAATSGQSQVCCVVVMAPHVFAEACGLDSIAAVRTQYQTGLRDKLAKYHGANVDCAFRGWSESWLHPDFARWNLEGFLPGITAPVLQLQGVDDQYGTAAQLDAIAAGVAGPCATHLLPDCRHAPQFEQPEKTLGLIAGFIARSPCRAAARGLVP